MKKYSTLLLFIVLVIINIDLLYIMANTITPSIHREEAVHVEMVEMAKRFVITQAVYENQKFTLTYSFDKLPETYTNLSEIIILSCDLEIKETGEVIWGGIVQLDPTLQKTNTVSFEIDLEQYKDKTLYVKLYDQKEKAYCVEVGLDKIIYK